MRALFIDAYNKEVRELTTDGSPQSLQKLVGGYLERALRVTDVDDLFVDESSRLKDPKVGFRVRGLSEPLVGCGVILAHDVEGNSASTQLDERQVGRLISFFDVVQPGKDTPAS